MGTSSHASGARFGRRQIHGESVSQPKRSKHSNKRATGPGTWRALVARRFAQTASTSGHHSLRRLSKRLASRMAVYTSALRGCVR